ncbi:unnamed protein product [Orchesella dallaii]|uniref:Uncharacterized protein n=1 Tax=Orchesella dallaii TaxID=48710 RepID=A0ABP1Q6Q1_9HEXA
MPSKLALAAFRFHYVHNGPLSRCPVDWDRNQNRFIWINCSITKSKYYLNVFLVVFMYGIMFNGLILASDFFTNKQYLCLMDKLVVISRLLAAFQGMFYCMTVFNYGEFLTSTLNKMVDFEATVNQIERDGLTNLWNGYGSWRESLLQIDWVGLSTFGVCIPLKAIAFGYIIMTMFWSNDPISLLIRIYHPFLISTHFRFIICFILRFVMVSFFSFEIARHISTFYMMAVYSLAMFANMLNAIKIFPLYRAVRHYVTVTLLMQWYREFAALNVGGAIFAGWLLNVQANYATIIMFPIAFSDSHNSVYYIIFPTLSALCLTCFKILMPFAVRANTISDVALRKWKFQSSGYNNRRCSWFSRFINSTLKKKLNSLHPLSIRVGMCFDLNQQTNCNVFSSVLQMTMNLVVSFPNGSKAGSEHRRFCL